MLDQLGKLMWGGRGKCVPTITQKASTGALVQAHQSQVPHNPEGRATGSAFNIFRDLALNLQADFDNLQGVGKDLTGELAFLRSKDLGLRLLPGTYNLTTSSHTTSEHLIRIPNLSGLLIGQPTTDQIIHGEFDSLLWSDTDQLRQYSRV